MMYTFRGCYVSEHMMRPLLAYIERHRRPGDFLQAVIRNNLHDAISRADEENLQNLPAFVGYLYNEAPAPCWGSKEALEAWVKRGETEETKEDMPDE